MNQTKKTIILIISALMSLILLAVVIYVTSKPKKDIMDFINEDDLDITEASDESEAEIMLVVSNDNNLTTSVPGSVTYIGYTFQLSLEGTSASTTWTSSDEAIARVSKNGLVTGVSEGVANITAENNGNRYSCQITVKKCSEGLEFTEIKDGYSVSGIGTCTDAEIVIPKTFNSKPVIKIGKAAFRGCKKITGVVIPGSIKSIEKYAFSRCNKLQRIVMINGVKKIRTGAFYRCSKLKDISIPESVTGIGSYAFYECKGLKQITIPKHVKAINKWTFYNCTKLSGISLPDNITEIGNYSFYGCCKLKRITLPNGVTNIGKWAFYNCTGLTKFNIPETVTNIGELAFFSCEALKEINIPRSVKKIGSYAFRCCTGLSKITVDSNNPKYDSRGNCNAIIESRTDTLLFGCKTTVIPDTVTDIAEQAFYHCLGLREITLPDSVKSIGSYAFDSCSDLTAVLLSPSLKSIGEWAFARTGLTAITIPYGLTDIYSGAFYKCYGLTEITLPDSITVIDHDAFSECSGLTAVYVRKDSFAEKWAIVNGYENNMLYFD